MRQAFLFGELAADFPEVVRPFVSAAGGPNAVIALLLGGTPDQERWVPAYRDPMLAAGAGTVWVFTPDPDRPEVPPEVLQHIRSSTGIFVGGGDPLRYHRLYTGGAVAALIRERYRAGVPYAGLSSGALIAPRCCILGGWQVNRGGHRCTIHARHRMKEAVPEELVLGEGLGLLSGCTVEVHCSEWGALPRLMAALEQSGCRCGLGIDEPACVELRDEQEGRVYGQGRVYWVQRESANRQFRVRVLEPGETFSLQTGGC